MSEGLTVPCTSAAGLVGAISNHWPVVIAGASEIANGVMGLGTGAVAAISRGASGVLVGMNDGHVVTTPYADVVGKRIALDHEPADVRVVRLRTYLCNSTATRIVAAHARLRSQASRSIGSMRSTYCIGGR